jgi:hypothetical protein
MRINRPAQTPDHRWQSIVGGVCAAAVMWCANATLWSDAGAATGTETEPQSSSSATLSPLATTGPKPPPIEAPEDAAIVAAIERGVDFLLADQRPDGSWGSPEGTKGLNIYAPPPGAHDGFRTATTSLVLMALIDAEPSLDEKKQAVVDEAINRGEEALAQRVTNLRRATPDALYNVWGHAYAIEALVALHERAADEPERQSRLRVLAAEQVEMLRRYQFINGGWSYYDFVAGTQQPSGSPMSFTTATVLIALHKAKQDLDLDYPPELVQKALDSLNRQRKPDFSYAYGEYLRMQPMHPVNRPGGSLGRSQACNLALRLFGEEDVTDEVLKTWLNRLFARNGWLDIGRKRPIPHEAHFFVAGYFYYYGHYYAAQCIEQLPTDRRPYYQEHLANIILPLQEKDGSWWDFPFYNYHQQYGTAMAVSTLARCRK